MALLAAACGGSPTAPPPAAALALVCPATIDQPSAGGTPVPVTFSSPAPSGGTPPISVNCQPGSGTSFSVGSTAVTCTASDAAGRQASCAFSVRVTTIAQLQHTRFLVFGDSLSEGKLSLLPNLLIDSPAHSYPFKLEALLRERYTAQTIVVLNEGFGGERADASYRRFQATLDTHDPEAVLLMHGLNDLNGDGLAGIQRAVDGIEDLVKEARRVGLATFVATLPRIGPGPKAGCPECIEPFNERVRAMAAAKGAFLVDVYAAWGSGAGLMGADGIHPTDAGYNVIAQAFFEAIRQRLEISPAP